MGTMKILGSALYQWEIGRKLWLIPSPGARAIEVQFAHPGDKEALTVIPKEENGIIVADIPNILLQSGQKIVAFLVDVDGDCVEITKHSVFHVVNRPKPADYVYTETEVLNYSDLADRIKALEENSGAIKTVNGAGPDENGNVQIATASSWNDLKDKPFYTETITIPRTVLADVELREHSDGYIANVETSIGFAAGDVVEVTFSGSNRYADVTLRGIAYAPNDFEVTVDLDHPDDNGMWLSFTEGRNMQIGSEWYTHAVVALPRAYNKEVVHTIEPKYLPNSVWTEKKTRVIIENQIVNGAYKGFVDNIFTTGETVTVVWDGVTYERVADQDGTFSAFVGERALYFETNESGEPFGVSCDTRTGITSNISIQAVDESKEHTVSIYVHEDVVKTNCDLHIKLTSSDINGEISNDTKRISGDFATIKAKMLKGLPATVLVNLTNTYPNGDDVYATDTFNEILPLYYSADTTGMEFIGCDNYAIYLLPDNTIDG